MAIAIMILSNEGGKDAVTTIAPSKEAAREVVGIAKRATGTKFLSVSSMAAPIILSEAYKVMGEQWEQDYTGQSEKIPKNPKSKATFSCAENGRNCPSEGGNGAGQGKSTFDPLEAHRGAVAG